MASSRVLIRGIDGGEPTLVSEPEEEVVGVSETTEVWSPCSPPLLDSSFQPWSDHG